MKVELKHEHDNVVGVLAEVCKRLHLADEYSDRASTQFLVGMESALGSLSRMHGNDGLIGLRAQRDALSVKIAEMAVREEKMRVALARALALIVELSDDKHKEILNELDMVLRRRG